MTIELFGETLDIAFNLAVQVTYEQITGEDFDLEATKKISNAVALYYAAILANNPDTKITMNDLMRKATANDVTTIANAVSVSVNEWCTGAKPSTDEAPEDEKNA